MPLISNERIRTLLENEDIAVIAAIITSKPSGPNNIPAFVGFADILKPDFLRTLFEDERTEDLFWRNGIDLALMSAVRRNNLKSLEFFVNQITTTDPRHERARNLMSYVFVEACQLGFTPIAEHLLAHPVTKLYINPFLNNHSALTTACARMEEESSISTEEVIRRVLLPLYDDQTLDDVHLMYEMNPVLLDTFFYELSETKKLKTVDFLLDNGHLTINDKEKFPNISVFLDKQEMTEALLPATEASQPRKPKVI